MEAYARYEVLLRSKADANERVFELGFLKVRRVVDARVVANKLCAESIFAHCIISFYGWQRSTCSFMRWVFEYPWMWFFFFFVFFLFCLFLNAKVSGVLLDLVCTLLISLMLATNANANFGKQTLFIQFQRKLWKLQSYREFLGKKIS